MGLGSRIGGGGYLLSIAYRHFLLNKSIDVHVA